MPYTPPFSGGVPGGSGALTLIQKVITVAGQISFTFSGISGSYTSLLLIASGRTTGASLEDNAILQFNGDTGANYTRQFTIASNVTITTNGSNSVPDTSAQVITFVGSLAPTGKAGFGSVLMANYSNTNFNKYLFTSGTWNQGNAIADFNLINIVGEWRNTAAINSIFVTTNSGSAFVAGSTFALYGVS